MTGKWWALCAAAVRVQQERTRGLTIYPWLRKEISDGKRTDDESSEVEARQGKARRRRERKNRAGGYRV
jgi:hypothetical protein